MIIFKLIGAFGLLCISAGILSKKRQTQDVLYIVGGISLEIYSIYLGDVVFMVLQVIVTAAAVYDLYKLKRQPK